MPEHPDLHGRPTALELLEAVREFLAGDVVKAGGRLGFHARVAANAVAIVERELRIGARQEAEHEEELAHLGFASEVELAAAIRAGVFDERMAELVAAVRATVRARLEVANPGYIPAGPDT